MGAQALTIEGTTSNPDEVLRRLGTSLMRVGNPSVVILFAMGQLAARMESVARGFVQRHPGLSLVLAATEGGFTERGVVESKDGYLGLIHGGRAVDMTAYDDVNEPFDLAAHVPGDSTVPSLLLLSSPPLEVTRHGRIAVGDKALGWFGAVTSQDGPLWAAQKGGQVRSAAALRVGFPALESPLHLEASCCRIVSDPFTVTAVSGTTLLELDKMPALVALGKVTSRLAERSWIVLGLVPDGTGMAAAISAEDGASATHLAVIEEPKSTIFRPLRGVDPARGALVLKEGIAAGARVAFAVRDDRAARRSLDDGLRRMKQRLSGAIPRFGLYFEGLGRGQQLFGASNVELSLIRQSLGDFPLLGCRSSNEFREQDRSVSVCSMSGQLALFRTPS